MADGKNKNEETSREILSTLAKEGAFKIMKEATSKLISRRGTPMKLNLTKRQYYTRLRNLKSHNLVKKEGEGYVQTEFGERVYELVSSLKKASEVNAKNDIEDLNSKFTIPNLSEGSETLIKRYDALVEKTLKLLEDAKSEVLLASRYIDYRVTKNILKLDSSVTLKIIGREFSSIEGINFFRALTSPEKLKQALKLAQDHTRIVKRLPYTFVIRDQEFAIVEVVNHLSPNDFFLAITLEDEQICAELVKYFENLFEMSDRTPLSSNEKPSLKNLLTLLKD
ncbi:hypothetical protein AKJ63_01880 [candidate division MSBL1 archaeon SCGC-AAA259D18]|uniref:Uncharacterized protein n=1 Tax=candidate division MSBL1 archaeon SCGC-AAA259D18 TaxID=1698262 RepID=A0A133UA80_9EURY|nr:hypothetical protein AKJ63_01880 [candidate division MSBL1 archaeon SCGC-AAA259D18]